MRFIHIADVHLGCSPEADFPWGKERGEELWDSFGAVIDACNEKQIDLLLIAGDLFDSPPVWADLERADRLFGMLEGTEVVMITGEKDYIRKEGPWLSFPMRPWVHLLSSRYPESVFLEGLNTSVTGCSYYEKEVPKPYLEDAKPDMEAEYRILLGHTGDETHMPADLDALAEAGFDYIALGHMHKPRLLSRQRTAWAGSLEPLDKTELGKHGFILGEIDNERTSIRFIPFSCREYIQLKVRMTSDITQEQLEEKLTEAMKGNGDENIYRICMEGRFLPGHPYDTGRLMELGNVTEVMDETSPDYNLVALLDEHQDDMIGMYLEEFLKEKVSPLQKKALYCGLEALLDHQEPGREE